VTQVKKKDEKEKMKKDEKNMPIVVEFVLCDGQSPPRGAECE
jgi:hypothetical protein